MQEFSSSTLWSKLSLSWLIPAKEAALITVLSVSTDALIIAVGRCFTASKAKSMSSAPVDGGSMRTEP